MEIILFEKGRGRKGRFGECCLYSIRKTSLAHTCTAQGASLCNSQHGNNSFFVFFFLQVHNLDPNTWKSVEVVHIDIADRTQVEPGVSKCSAVHQLIPLALCVGTE